MVLAVVATLLVAPARHAAADPLPPTKYAPVSLSDMADQTHLVTEPGGGVTVGCANGAVGARRVNAAGNVVHDMPNVAPHPNTCARSSVVGRDGTLYTLASTWPYLPKIQAIKDGAVKWTYEFTCRVVMQGMVIGTNGNVYAMATGTSWPCGGQTTLLGFAPEPAPGSTTPTILFNTAGPSGVLDGGIAAYNNGLVLRTTGGIEYRSYEGAVLQTFPIEAVLNGVYQDYQDATLGGRVFTALRAATPHIVCGNDNLAVSGIVAWEPSGYLWTHTSLPTCSHVFEMRPTPSGGVVVHYDAPPFGTPIGERTRYLMAIDADGERLWQTSLTLPSDTIDMGSAFAVDVNGNVVSQTHFRHVLATPQGTMSFPALSLVVRSGLSGIVVNSARLAGETAAFNGSGYSWAGPLPNLHIGKGTWFVAAKECTAWPHCNASSSKLYAFDVPGLGMDYPRGAILTPVTAKKYAALGDSFSSGEGVPEFEAGTNVPGNTCHRSKSAYPNVISNGSSSGWKLYATSEGSSFVACAGATTRHVVEGGDSQLQVLDAETEVVTLTIGGNDIGFADFVTLCLFKDCSQPEVYQPFFGYLSQFMGDRLVETYAAVHNAALNARVIVGGYPQLLPQSMACGQTDGWMAYFAMQVALAHAGESDAIGVVYGIGRRVGLSESEIEALIDAGTVVFSSEEVAVARALTIQLNERAEWAIAQIGQPWIEYRDPLVPSSPFMGNELCSATPYFNGLDAINPGYSYHPNGQGQYAYAQIFIGD